MPPCGTPDTSFIDLEIEIFTLWLRPVRKDTNHLQQFGQIHIFLFSHKIRMGTRCHKLQIDPTVFSLFSEFSIHSCCIDDSAVIVDLFEQNPCWFSDRSPCSYLITHYFFQDFWCHWQAAHRSVVFFFWLGLLFSVLGLLGPLSTLKEIHH